MKQKKSVEKSVIGRFFTDIQCFITIYSCLFAVTTQGFENKKYIKDFEYVFCTFNRCEYYNFKKLKQCDFLIKQIKDLQKTSKISGLKN